MKALLSLTILSAALLLAPLIVAAPPIAQTEAMLALAHAAPTVGLVLWLGVAVAAGLRMRPRWTWSGAALLAVTLVLAGVSRLNLVERIFPGANGAEFEPISRFHDVRETDMVIGVVLEG